jgi:hypothetical protein
MVDMPNHAVLIAGLEFWKGDKERIYEERLERWLSKRLEVSELKLFAPPVDTGDPLTRDRQIKPVVPVRFVQASVRGHIGDVNWYGFVRRDYKMQQTGDLWLDEGGAGNDFAEIYVRDEKNGNQRRPLSEAALRDGTGLGWCGGRSL